MVGFIHLKMAVLAQYMWEVTRIRASRYLESPDRARG
jgi:hypothetical protein